MDTPGGQEAVRTMVGLAGAHDLRRRADSFCREWLRSAAEQGDLAALALAEIQVVFERCALVFDNANLSYPYVETRLGLYVPDPTGVYFRGLRPVGNYRLITRLDGSIDDDYFVLDPPRPAELFNAPEG